MTSLSDLLDLLSRAHTLDTRSASDIPHIAVQMGSGARYEGVMRQRTETMIAVADVQGGLHHLDINSIEGITVMDAQAARDVLSGGREERFVHEVPGSHAIQRKAAAIGAELGIQIDLQPSDVGQGSERIALDRQLETLRGALNALFAERGEAARGCFSRVQFKSSAEPRVSAQGGTLTLGVNLSGGPNGRLALDSLRDAIASAA